MNLKDRLYNREVREVRRRSPHWRMRSPSEEGRDNITHPERGPLGTGGDALAGDPHTLAGYSVLRRAASKDGVKVGFAWGYGGVGLNPGGPAEGSVPNWGVA